jgi:hypothetical protein
MDDTFHCVECGDGQHCTGGNGCVAEATRQVFGFRPAPSPYSPDRFPKSRIALAHYDAVQKPRLDAMWATAMTNKQVRDCQRTQQETRQTVAEAFWEDTKAYNHRSMVINYMSILDVREVLAKYPAPPENDVRPQR